MTTVNGGVGDSPVTLAVIGAGSRGAGYSEYATDNPQRAQVVAVAEPRNEHRRAFQKIHGIPDEMAFADWRELAARPKLADAVLIATPDRQHVEPAVTLAGLNYDVLLEKPMAPSPEECRRITEAADGIVFAVCHVLRYQRYTAVLKQLLDEGAIGQLQSVQHLEPVGYWHYAHSYVRGNWRNEAEASPMLLAKSCHDIDLLRYLIGARCTAVSSFGSLTHFTPENKPAEAGSATRCLECKHEPDCAYSAPGFYLGRLEQGNRRWPVNVVTRDTTEDGVLAALRTGPYGRCVYECDNDVVDHQVVTLQYETGVTASFTMVGTSKARHRETVLFGSHGELRGDGHHITHVDFRTGAVTEHDVDGPTGTHSADHTLVEAFVEAVRTRNPGTILSGPAETLETHLTVFAAEQSRREGRIVPVPQA